MAYWVEVHCNYACTAGHHGCYTDVGDNPGGKAQSPQKAARHAEAAAKRSGWVKRGVEWICPSCRKVLAAQALETSSAAGAAAFRAQQTG